jgi:hypothetical protein
MLFMQIYTTDDDHNQSHIAHLFHKLRNLYGGDFHLFYVVDEAQIGATKISTAFYTDGRNYPILRELMTCIEDASQPQECSFVVVGTEVPQHSVETKENADRLRWC